MNTTESLLISSSIVPDRLAIIYDGKHITYQNLADRVNQLSNTMADLGVNAGDRVGMFQVNSNAYIETYFAAAKLDAIFLPLNFLFLKRP